jgi:hypothetical protein
MVDACMGQIGAEHCSTPFSLCMLGRLEATHEPLALARRLV